MYNKTTMNKARIAYNKQWIKDNPLDYILPHIGIRKSGEHYVSYVSINVTKKTGTFIEWVPSGRVSEDSDINTIVLSVNYESGIGSSYTLDVMELCKQEIGNDMFNMLKESIG